MEKQRMESMIIDYIDGRLNAVDRKLIEDELMRSEGSRKIYEELKFVISAMEQSESLKPSRGLEANFQKELQKAIKDESRTKTIFFRPAFYRVAAAVVLMVVSGVIGFWISRNNAQQQRLADIEREMEITRKQLADTKALMLGMIDNNQSASQRLKGVNVAMELPKADKEIVEVLFKTLQSDQNTNVRLAALDALAKFHGDPEVRKGLARSLLKQSDPMVQIRLIQLMVDINERSVVDDLQKMVDDAGTMGAVKDEAYSGILKLS